MRKGLSVAIAAPVIFSSCGVERPLMPDGQGKLILTVADMLGLLPGSIEGVPFYLDSTSVKIELQTEIFTGSKVTNAAGIACFDHLDTGRYLVFARREIFLGSAKKTFTGSFPAYAKEMMVRIGAGFASIGILRYSGYSAERRELGLDTNDSTFDIMNLVHPTPGYLHGQ